MKFLHCIFFQISIIGLDWNKRVDEQFWVRHNHHYTWVLQKDVNVIGCIQLECKGPNMGVEHSELEKVIEVTWQIGVFPGNGFISDSAAILKKAFVDVLSKVCTKAIWITCSSHMLNNMGKAVAEAFPPFLFNRQLLEHFPPSFRPQG